MEGVPRFKKGKRSKLDGGGSAYLHDKILGENKECELFPRKANRELLYNRVCTYIEKIK